MKLARANNGANKLVVLRQRQTVSNVSVQKLPAELKEVRLQLVKVTAERLELFIKLHAIKEKSDKRLEDLAAVRGGGRGAFDRAKELVRFIVGKSV